MQFAQSCCDVRESAVHGIEYLLGMPLMDTAGANFIFISLRMVLGFLLLQTIFYVQHKIA